MIKLNEENILFPDNSIIIKDQNIEKKFTHAKKFWDLFINNNIR
jgi:hypothetical protein